MPETLYTLEVCNLDGPVAEEPDRVRPSPVRTIEITGDQTLRDLHRVIFTAFGRWDDYVGFLFDDGPLDCGGIRYGPGSPSGMIDPFDAGQPVGDPAHTSIEALGLEAGQSFGYWFNLWDDWYHQISVLAVGEADPQVEYPRVMVRDGGGPPRHLPLRGGWGNHG
jgi:hypothetical protein